MTGTQESGITDAAGRGDAAAGGRQTCCRSGPGSRVKAWVHISLRTCCCWDATRRWQESGPRRSGAGGRAAGVRRSPRRMGVHWMARADARRGAAPRRACPARDRDERPAAPPTAPEPARVHCSCNAESPSTAASPPARCAPRLDRRPPAPAASWRHQPPHRLGQRVVIRSSWVRSSVFPAGGAQRVRTWPTIAAQLAVRSPWTRRPRRTVFASFHARSLNPAPGPHRPLGTGAARTSAAAHRGQLLQPQAASGRVQQERVRAIPPVLRQLVRPRQICRPADSETSRRPAPRHPRVGGDPSGPRGNARPAAPGVMRVWWISQDRALWPRRRSTTARGDPASRGPRCGGDRIGLLQSPAGTRPASPRRGWVASAAARYPQPGADHVQRHRRHWQRPGQYSPEPPPPPG